MNQVTLSLDDRAAKIMGWKYRENDIGGMYGDQPIWLEPWDHPEQDGHSFIFTAKEWAPSTRWDHAFILIDWAQENDNKIAIVDLDQPMMPGPPPGYRVMFSNWKTAKWSKYDGKGQLSPSHITEAFVKAFEKEKKDE